MKEEPGDKKGGNFLIESKSDFIDDLDKFLDNKYAFYVFFSIVFRRHSILLDR